MKAVFCEHKTVDEQQSEDDTGSEYCEWNDKSLDWDENREG